MTEKEIHKLLQQYGMSDPVREPYLYKGSFGVGIYYTIMDRVFGFLERIKTFQNKEEAEDFIYQYWWYKKHWYDLDVDIKLDNYEIENPELKYLFQGKEISVSDMKEMNLESSSNKTETEYTKLLRTATLLLNVIDMKIKLQQQTQMNSETLFKEYEELMSDYETVYRNIVKETTVIERIAKGTSLVVSNDEILRLQEELNRFHETFSGIPKIRKLIESLWSYLHQLESDESYLYHRYLLIKLPVLMNDYRRQKDYLSTARKRSFGFLLRKDDILIELKKIESQQESQKIVLFAQYNENELKRLEDKYSVLNALDYRTVAEYLIEFDNLEISTKIELEQKVKSFSKEEIINDLTEQYANLNIDEQAIFVQYNSFLKPLIKEILTYSETDLKEVLKKLKEKGFYSQVKQSLIILESSDNLIIKLKYFKNIDSISEEAFVQSLLHLKTRLLSIAPMHLLGSISVFFRSSNMLFDEQYLDASLLPTNAPCQKIGFYQTLYSINLDEVANVFFLPIEVNFHQEVSDGITLKVYLNRQGILCLTENSYINNINFDILNVSQYQSIYDKKISAVIGMKQKAIATYKIQKVDGE